MTNGSMIKGLRLKNAPMHGIYINNSHDAIFTDILIDNSDGDEVRKSKKNVCWESMRFSGRMWPFMDMQATIRTALEWHALPI